MPPMNFRALPLIAACLLLVGVGGCATTQLSARDGQSLAGRTVVITGASSGFGRGAAVKFGRYHANVVLAARRSELLNEVAAQVSAAGGTPLVVTTDVSKPEDVQHLADATLARFGKIDVWINDVGVGAIGRFWEIPLADQARVVDVNLKGVIYGSYAAVRQFRIQGNGVLVNVGSIDSVVPLAYQATYSSTKAAVLGLDKALIEELRLAGAKDIKVATIMPWAVDTPWWPHAANYSGGTPRMAAMDPPEKVVDAIVYASLHPREKMPVGWKAQAATVSHGLMPDLTERMSANIADHYQIKTAPPAPPTDGTLFQPMAEGRDVEGGVRARMKREDEARKASGGASPR
jgi:short-subunit dehydrogenase